MCVVVFAVWVVVPYAAIVMLPETMSRFEEVSPFERVSVLAVVEPSSREFTVTAPLARSRVGWLVPPFMMTSSAEVGATPPHPLQFVVVAQVVLVAPVQVQVLARAAAGERSNAHTPNSTLHIAPPIVRRFNLLDCAGLPASLFRRLNLLTRFVAI